jgi:hypothetical protein
VQAVAETRDGQTVSGTIQQTAHTYYGSVSAATTDSMVRYWPMQEESGDIGYEEIESDDAAFYSDLTIGSTVISGATIRHRVFSDGQYGQASYALPASTSDFTAMIQLQSDTVAGDHTWLNFGADVAGIAVDNTTGQINTQGAVDSWTSATPFNEIKTLFLVCDRTAGWIRLYDLSSGSAVQRINRTTLPNADGDAIRFGRGSSGDGHHQDNEYLGTATDPGYIRSVAVWERALSTSDMEDISDFLDNQGGLLVQTSTAPDIALLGEVNTASNLSPEGNVGVFTEKIGTDLRFKSLDGDIFWNNNNVIQLRDRGNVIDVAVSGTNFSSIQAAIDSIEDASVNNRYMIDVGPGVYVENIYMKDWIDVRGAAIDDTVINGTVNFLTASGSSPTGESNLRDLNVEATVSGATGDMIYIEGGEHSFSSVVMSITCADSVGNMLNMLDGTCILYTCRMHVVATGNYTGPDPFRMIYHQGGTLNFAISQVIGLLYQENMNGYCIHSTGDENSSFGIYNIMQNVYSLNPTASGSFVAFKVENGSEHNAVKGNRIHFSSVGGNETFYCFELDSDAGGHSSNKVRSNSNQFILHGIDEAYFAKLHNQNDFFISHFDDLSGLGEIIGSISNYEMVSSDTDGSLRATRDITLGRKSPVDQDLIIVDIGEEVEADNPKLKFDYDYFDYSMLTWSTASGSVANVTHSPEGPVLMGSMSYGDNAFDYEQRLSVWAHRDSPYLERRGYRMKRKTDESFAISRHWTYLDGGAFVDLLNIDHTGGLSLRYGDGSKVSAIYDEDDFASNSASGVATQQSIKAYVAAQDAEVIEYVNSYVAPYRYIAVTASGGAFNSIQAAIDSITVENDDDYWVIEVYPGTYVEDVYLKDNVSLVGVSYDTCIIEGRLFWTAASGCSEGYWSGIQNMAIYNFPDGDEGYTAINVDAGYHDIVNCYTWLEATDCGAKTITVSGGGLYSYVTQFEQGAYGDSGGGGHDVIRVVDGEYKSYSDNIIFYSEDPYNLTTIFNVLGNESTMNISNASVVAEVDNVTYSGTTIGFKIGGESTHHINASRMLLKGTGAGTAYGYYSLTATSGCTLHSSANHIHVEDFEHNYFAHVGPNSEIQSHFDDVKALSGRTGETTNYKMVQSETPGKLRITGGIEVGDGTGGDHTMVQVHVDGLADELQPAIVYDADYFGYVRGAWWVPSGSLTWTAESSEGPVLVGSMSQGPNAFDYEQRLSVWGHETDNGTPLGYERRGYRLKRKTDESFAISRHWTYEDGGAFVDLMNIDPWGGMALRYGTGRVSAIYDEDDMASNSASGICTQQSIKAYVDNAITNPNHLTLTNLQGGTSGEYYHLTEEDYTTITGGYYLPVPTPITPATHTKITYDANGLVTSGTNATTEDITSVSGYRYLTDEEKVIYTYGLSTGIIEGGVLSINANGIDVDLTAGSSLYADFTDATSPVVEILRWPAQTISGGLSSEVGRLWLGVERTAPNTAGFTTSEDFTHLEKRTIAVLGRYWGNGTEDIEGVGQYTTSTFGLDYALIDLMKTLGSLNRSGNIFFPTSSGGLTLDKTTGESFRFSANFGGQPTAPHVHSDPSMSPVVDYHYHYYNAPATVLTSAIDPDQYDVDGTLTAVSGGKFTVQRIYYYPKSNVVDLVYGQELYDTLDDAEVHASSESVNIDETNLASLFGSILRGYLIVQEGTTDLTNTDKAKVLIASNFGAAGASSAIGGITKHNDLDNIQGGAAGDYYHLTSAQVTEFSTTSGALVSWVTENYPDNSQFTTSSGDIVTWVGGQGYVVGPGSSTVNHVPVFSNTTGDLVADSGVTISSQVITAAGIITTDDIKAATLFQVDVGNNQINFGDVDGTPNSFITSDGKVSIGGGNITGNNLLQIDHSGTTNKTETFSSSSFEIDAEDGNYSDFVFRLSGSGYPVISLAKSNGDLAAPTIVADTDNIGSIFFIGYDGDSWDWPAQITATVDGTPGAGDIPTKLTFGTSPDGSSTAVTRMTIKPDGKVGISTETPAEILDTGTGNAKTNFIMAEKLDLTERSSAPGDLGDGDMWHQNDDDFRARTNGRTMVQGMVNMIQCRHATGATRVDCNTASWLPITWNVEDVKDSLYTHSTTVNSSRITIGTTGWYKITYCIGHENQVSSRSTVETAIRVNGSTLLSPGRCYSYARNTTDEMASNQNSSIHRLTAGQYIEIVATNTGSTGSVLTMQGGQTHVLVELVRFSA